MTSTVQFAYFDRARNVAHFDSNWPALKLEKKFVRASPKPKLENYESLQHKVQFSGIKRGLKFHFIGTFKNSLTPSLTGLVSTGALYNIK